MRASPSSLQPPDGTRPVWKLTSSCQTVKYTGQAEENREMLKTVLKRLAGSGEGLADAGCCSLLLAALAWSPLYLASFGSCLFFRHSLPWLALACPGLLWPRLGCFRLSLEITKQSSGPGQSNSQQQPATTKAKRRARTAKAQTDDGQKYLEIGRDDGDQQRATSNNNQRQPETTNAKRRPKARRDPKLKQPTVTSNSPK